MGIIYFKVFILFKLEENICMSRTVFTLNVFKKDYRPKVSLQCSVELMFSSVLLCYCSAKVMHVLKSKLLLPDSIILGVK